jgi:hypothetical protein
MMTDNEQRKQDFEIARRYRTALEEIAEMKIPYCDAYDVANMMRDTAKEIARITGCTQRTAKDYKNKFGKVA